MFQVLYKEDYKIVKYTIKMTNKDINKYFLIIIYNKWKICQR